MKNFIPDLIGEKVSENIHSGTFTASTIFIDISGFTSMTQFLMEHGKEGAEILSNIINNIFSPSIRAVYDNGGFVSTFAGDAFTSIFETEKVDYALKAAFEINRVFAGSGKINTKFGEFELSVKIGISHGEVEYGIIDAEVQKAFYFRGEAIDACAKSEHQAEKMQIVADRKFVEQLTVEVEKDSCEEQWFILTPRELDLSPIGLKSVPDISDETEKDFVPDSVLEMKERGEFREIVSVFIGFEESAGYAESVKQVIKNTHAYGGYFNKIDFGDKGGVMLVIFGAPTGREKLYSRAADFALSLKQIEDFKYRSGVSTGIAFCGIVGSDLRKEYTALGNVVNLSARLMMKAEPHEILTAPQIRSKLPAQYRLENKGLTEFKGFSEKIEIFSLTGKTALKQQMTYSGSFVGRKKEAEKLRKMIRPIFDNKFAGIVYIDGPAGIGKSRFIDNFVNRIDNCASFYLPCDEILRKSFNPFEYFLKNYFEQSESLSKKQNKDNFTRKFAGLISQIKDEEIKSELVRTESFIGDLIGLEWENSLYSQLDAKGKYENTLYALKNFFLAPSLLKPVIIILEDAHWIDNDSLSMFDMLTRNIGKYPIVILALCRPKDDGSLFDLFDPEKAEAPINRLNIEPFNKEMMGEILKDRFAADSIPNNTSDFIWKKSIGNPFFVEQLALFLTENNLLDKNLNLISEAKSIPLGISQIIISRIDRLSVKMKETVKTASVLGREFALKVLERMLGSKITDRRRLLQAGKNEQIWENLTELKYIFKHALIRDAVYEAQLKESLRKLHELAGNIIEDLHPEELKEHYEELADHYAKSENKIKAKEYLYKAGKLAMENFRNEKALNYFDKLLNLYDKNGEAAKVVECLQYSAKILKLTGKWDASVEKFESALKIAKEQNDTINVIDCRNNLSLIMHNRGRLKEAMECFENTLKIAEEINYEHGIANIYVYMGNILQIRGDNDRAMEYLNRSLEIFKNSGSKKGIALALGCMGNMCFYTCDYKKALDYYAQQNQIYEEIADKKGIGVVLGSIGSAYYTSCNFEKANEFFNKQLAVSAELGDLSSVSLAYGRLGTIFVVQGDFEKAMEYYEKQMRISQELDDRRSISLALGNIAAIYKFENKLPEALSTIDKGLTICRESDNKYYLCVSLNLKASVLFDMNRIDEAKAANDECMQIANDADIKDYAFLSEILLNIIEKDVDAFLEILKKPGLDEAQLADIHYELWKLTKEEEHRIKSVSNYRKALDQFYYFLYARRIEEMEKSKP